MFRQKSFKTFLFLSLFNQAGHLNMFRNRYPIMDENDDDKNKGGGPGDDKDKDGNPIYKKDFVDKLLTEKNNFKKGKEALEAEVAELKKKLEAGPKKDDSNADDKTKELLKAKDEELKKVNEKLTAREKERTDAMKLGTLKIEFDKSGGNPKQWDLIQRLTDTSKILIDDDTQVVYGAEAEIKRIKELAPEFFGTKKKGVEDGDTSNNTNTDGEKDLNKLAEGKRLQKDKKTGENPLVAFFAAQGANVTKTRS